MRVLAGLVLAIAAAGSSAAATQIVLGDLSSESDAATVPLGRTPRHIPGLAAFHAQRATALTMGIDSVGAHHLGPMGEERRVGDEIGYVPRPSRAELHRLYPAQTFTQPLDHTDPSNNVTFEQRYWVSTKHYKPPSKRSGEKTVVYLLDSGEANGEDRLPYLDHGILDILAAETNGISIVIEHRYYGTSYPNRSTISPQGSGWDTDAMRFLNNTLALEDSARFARLLKLPDIEEDITAGPGKTPWISYGGSYPGQRSAHLRLLYPELFTGAIASSAVVAAITDYHPYFFPIARGAKQACIQSLQAAIHGFDQVAVPSSKVEAVGNIHSLQQGRNASSDREALLRVFGVPGLTHLVDLANVITSPLGYYQGLNWDPVVSSGRYWDGFCDALSKDTQYSISLAEHGAELGLRLPKETYRLAAYTRHHYTDECVSVLAQDGGEISAADACLATTLPQSSGGPSDLSVWWSWGWQVCQTQGYFMPAPPRSDFETGQISGPKLISSLITLDYVKDMCSVYGSGKVFSLPSTPNTTEVNALGGFDLNVDNLAIIDGEFDPWRPATAHSDEYAFGGIRSDTLDRPFKLIPTCWHHCDENSLPAEHRYKEPARIRQIHAEQVEFVRHWLNSTA